MMDDDRALLAEASRQLAARYRERADELDAEADRLESDADLDPPSSFSPRRRRRVRGELDAAVMDCARRGPITAEALANEMFGGSKPNAAAALSRLKVAGRLRSRKDPGRLTEYFVDGAEADALADAALG